MRKDKGKFRQNNTAKYFDFFVQGKLLAIVNLLSIYTNILTFKKTNIVRENSVKNIFIKGTKFEAVS